MAAHFLREADLMRSARHFFFLLLALAAPRARAGFDFAELRAEIESRGVRSIEALLPLLPEDLRAHHTLVFQSRSLQAGSGLAPRAILYGSSGRLVLSFNGDARQPGFLALETMEYDSDAGAFHFREIRFPASAEGAVEFREDVRCLHCHGAPARPIWDSYPLWPGAYGQVEQAALTGAEREQLTAFLEQQPAHPRYRFLPAEAWQARLRISAAHQYEGAARPSPNAELGTRLGQMNQDQLARTVLAAPGFADYRYALAGALNPPCSVEELLPARLRASWSAGYPAFRRAAAEADLAQQELKQFREAYGNYSHATGPRLDETETRFRYLVELGLGISTSGWTMEQEKGTFDFRGAALSGLEPLLAAPIARDDPTFNRLHADREHQEQYCAYLRRRSLALLGPRAPEPAPARKPTSNAALARCASCHTGDIAPRLPMDDPGALAHQLLSQQTARGPLIDDLIYRLSPHAGADKMPRDANLTEAERREIADYFLQLAEQERSRAAPR